MLQKFRTDLNLTPAQTEKISLVLDDYRHYYQSVQDQLDDIRATGKMRILQELDPGAARQISKDDGRNPATTRSETVALLNYNGMTLEELEREYVSLRQQADAVRSYL